MILITLGVISLIFLIIIRRNGGKVQFIHFISTLLATLIGVLLAVTLSNSEKIKKEKEDTVKLINSASQIIEMTYIYSTGLESYLGELKKGSINNSDSLVAIFKNKNPLPYPDLIETIIANELITKNMSEFSYVTINSVIINLNRVRDYESINTYKRSLKELEILFEMEMEYQKGKLKLKVMNDEYILRTKEFSHEFYDTNTKSVEVNESE